MSSGKTHDRIGLALGPIAALGFGLVSQQLHNPSLLWVGAIAYTVGITHLSPDLDLKSNPYHRWSLLKFIWHPYQSVCPHRGFSHDILIGTLSRVLYLLLPLMAIAGLYLNATATPFDVTVSTQAIVVALIGLELSAWVHLALDGILIERLFFGAKR
jgi:uncharacterized metal-binding protein